MYAPTAFFHFRLNQNSRRRFPPSCLLRIAYDDGTAPPTPEVPSAPNYFVRQGACWFVRFNGGPQITLLPSKGAAYLHILLSQPYTPVSAAELACRVTQCPERYALGDAGETLDKDALSAYRARCVELAEDIRQAREDHDEAAQNRAEEELRILTEEIERAKGLGGRIRKAADDAEKVRKKVGVAIRRAVEDIGKYNRQLADHLQSPRLTCGRSPCYRPEPVITWSV